MITWNDTFEIIKIMFNIDQKTIAYLMDVPDYKISRIKTGNLTPSFSNEDIYRKIFDPNTKDSPAKDTEKYLLSTLEDIIKNGFDNVKEAMKDYWVEDDKYKDGDYKIFVIKMLERTLYIPSPKEKSVSSDLKREAGLNNDKIEDPFSNNEATDTLSQPALPNITIETVSNIDVISDQQAKISNSDKVEETSLHTKAPVILDEAESAGIDNEQEPLAPDVADEMSDNDGSDDSSLNIETTTLPNANRTGFRIDSSGAQLPIPDEYRRCLFCTRWKGNTSIAYKSISGVFGDCIMYKREQISTGGTDCKNYEPDYDRIGFKEAVKPMSSLLE